MSPLNGPMTGEPTSPDEQAVFDAVPEARVQPRAARNAVRRVREVAAHSIAALIESKFGAVNARFDGLNAKPDAPRREIAANCWLIGIC